MLSGSFATRARQQLALLLHEIAVHEEQPLQRHAGGEALLGRQVGAREVEQLQILVELVAADLAVDRAAVEGGRQRRRTARPSSYRGRRTTNSSESRICSAVMRWRLARQYSRLPESFSKFVCVVLACSTGRRRSA